MKLLHYAVVLGGICLLCALGVAGVYTLTKPRIDAAEAATADAARGAALPGAERFELIKQDGTPYDPQADAGYPLEDLIGVATDGAGATIGYAAQGAAQGYSSRVKVMVGLDASGERIVDLTIVSQQETPGLGTRIAQVESKKTLLALATGKKIVEDPDRTPKFLRQFRGLAPSELRLSSAGSEVDAISGATVSSTAVVNAVRAAVAKVQHALGAEAPPEE
jgi:RnfABCDGE-type electron transport complex G subunit